MSCFPDPSWCHTKERQIALSISKSLSFSMEPPGKLNHGGKENQLSLRVQQQDSTSHQSADQSNNENTVTGGSCSQEQCISSASGQDESYENHSEDHVKLVNSMFASDHGLNALQNGCSYQMTHFAYPYASPQFTGLVTAYAGAPAIIQGQMMGITSARVPLPIDLAQDGPIYVNAKQYNGILRRRQTRAKLEAQKKIIKSRKPYLHESRHIHAVNRVRGSGGRFLSKKQFLLQPDPAASTAPSHTGSADHIERNRSVTAWPDIGNFSSANFWQSEGRFSSIPVRTMPDGGMCTESQNQHQHRAPAVQ